MKKRVDLAFPEFLFIVATRAALGAGVGLLSTARMKARGRRRLGFGLFAAGALTTIPALWLLFGKQDARSDADTSDVREDEESPLPTEAPAADALL